MVRLVTVAMTRRAADDLYAAPSTCGDDGVELTDDPARIDVDLLHRWLSEQAYWAKGRSHDTVRASVEASWCVGAYDGPEMVGFARMVTDRSTHAWLCVVFVAPARRGQGIGRLLVDRAVEQGREWGLRRIMLATRDAHEVYRRAGFEDVEDGVFMQLWIGPTAGR
ncbi:MAG: family acetyltransferase [Frankiales bacterium]|nr:family acetyltransferase [Frankiales bacterium]